MPNHSTPNMDPAEIMRILQTPAGQQLMAMLRGGNAQQLRNAAEKASGGDYRDAQKAIRDFLSNPEAQALVEQLRRP